MGFPTPFLGAAECIREYAAQFRNGGFVAVDRQGLLLPIGEHPQIVKAKNMVGVAVGVEDCINPVNVVGQGLQAEFGSSID